MSGAQPDERAAPGPPPPGATADIFLGGRVTVYQPETGFRAGTDSVLLAAALDADQRGEALDVGCGAGGALLPAAWRLETVRFTGLEQDPAMATLAAHGARENGFAGRIDIVEGNAAAMPAEWAGRFDLVFSNPPFFEQGAIAAPGKGKEDAYLESMPVGAWIDAMLFALRPKGRLVLIHRAAAITEILATLDGRAGEIQILPVRPYPGADAKRILVRGRKGLKRGPARLLSGIDLYDRPSGPRSALSAAVSAKGEAVSWNAKPRPA